MTPSDANGRFKKLRDLREKLCKQKSLLDKDLKDREWLVDQLKTLHDMTDVDAYSKDDIKDRLADLLCVFEPSEDDDDDE